MTNHMYERMNCCVWMLATVIAATDCPAIWAAEPERDQATGSVLRLVDDSSVPGTLVMHPSGDVIEWQAAPFTRPFEFLTSAVSEIRFPVVQPTPAVTGEFAFEFRNGDLLTGKIVDWKDGRIVVQSERCGRLNIDETSITRMLRIDGQTELIFSGLAGLQDWQTVTGEWSSLGGETATQSPGAGLIGKFDFTDQIVTEFEIGWETEPNFAFKLGIDPKLPNQKLGAWSFEVWDDLLVVVYEDDKAAVMEPVFSFDESTDRLSLVTYLDRKTQTLHVYNGSAKLLASVEVPQAEPAIQDKPNLSQVIPKILLPPGLLRNRENKNSEKAAQPTASNGIQLINFGKSLQLKRLRITSWNGTLPSSQAKDTTLVQLAGGKNYAGTLTGFDAEARTLELATADESLSLSLETISSIQMNSTAQPKAHPLVAHLQDRTRISGRLEQVTEDTIVFQNDNLLEPIEVMQTHVGTILNTATKKQAPKQSGRMGTLKLDELILKGTLVPGEATATTSPLHWQPQFSRVASPLKPLAAGEIVYRERPPQPTQAQREQAKQAQLQRRNVVQRPANALQAFGQLFLKKAEQPRVNKPNVASEPHDIHLITGDVLPCRLIRIDDTAVHFESSHFSVSQIPHARIKAVVLDRTRSLPKLDNDKKVRLLTLPRNQKSSPPKHLLCASDGDYLRCRVNQLSDEMLQVELHLAELELPVRRLSHIIWLHPENMVAKTDDAADSTNELSAADVDTPQTEVATDNSADAEAGDVEAADEPGKKPALQKSLHMVQVIFPNGNRSTFTPEQVDQTHVRGHSEVVGDCTFACAEVDRIVFGSQIVEATRDLPYQNWKLKPAIEPLYLAETDEGGSGGQESALVGKPAPDFRLDLLAGGEFKLSEARGKIIVLDFWATWCGPCMLTMPFLEKEMKTFDPDLVQLISVNLEERPDQIREVLERNKWDLQVALDIDGVVAQRYSVTSIPQLIVIDTEGNVARLYVGGGANVVDQLKLAIEELLGDQAI